MTGGVEWAPGPNVVGTLEPKQGAEVICVWGGGPEAIVGARVG